METLEITIPYAWTKFKPRQIDTPKMLNNVTDQIQGWVSGLSPKFTNKDALHLADITKQETGLYLKYEIIRNKWATE